MPLDCDDESAMRDTRYKIRAMIHNACIQLECMEELMQPCKLLAAGKKESMDICMQNIQIVMMESKTSEIMMQKAREALQELYDCYMKEKNKEKKLEVEKI